MSSPEIIKKLYQEETWDDNEDKSFDFELIPVPNTGYNLIGDEDLTEGGKSEIDSTELMSAD